MRSRFEEHYVKSGRGGRKLEEVREKYQRACRRLHLVHNEYVLLITDAQETTDDFTNILLPCLMQHQQTIFQSFISTWQEIMREIAQCWSAPLGQYASSCEAAQTAINKIKPTEEYASLQVTQNGVTHAEPEFTFDTNLVEDTTGRLQADQLAVDNLTVDWVRTRMVELETSLKECQNNIPNNNNATAMTNNCDLATKEVRSKERKLMRQISVIKKALTEIGCEELPNGIDLPAIENGEVENFQTSSSPTTLKRLSSGGSYAPSSPPPSAGSIVDILWKPFRRKSSPNSPVLGLRNGHEMSEPASSGVCTTVSAPSIPELASLACPNSANKCSPPSPPDIPYWTTNNSTSCVMLGSSTKSLVEEEWFHGVLPREEVVRLLTKDGDFLVRETTRNDENQTVLSVCWSGHKHFIVQTTAEGEYRFEGPSFPTIQELIAFQYQSGLPVTSRSGTILRQPIPRERWELNNDDVYLIQKIGRGNFGDVYKARLRSSNAEVAVKTCRVTVPEEHKKKFLQEGRILKQYDHPNVVKLIGICVQKQPIMIVMELVAGGSLLTFLRNNAAILNQNHLLEMCRDIAAGMRYLESKNCIHRDLAARNCLIGKDNIVKISDFGMSREEEEYIVSDGMKQIPIKWTAPEALNFGKYTSLCDVWSYGILVWEVFSRGGTPYAGLSNSKAREKIDSGYRMPAPEGTPEELYRLMLKCWEYQPENRPHFDQVFNIVDAIVASYAQ